MSQGNSAELRCGGKFWAVFRDGVVVAEFVPFCENHDRHDRKLFRNRADVGGSLGSEIRSRLKVRLSKRLAVDDFSFFGDEDSTIKLASFKQG